MGAVAGRRRAVGLALLRPARACGRPDVQVSELAGEDPVREVLQDMLDAVELGVGVGDSFQVLVRDQFEDGPWYREGTAAPGGLVYGCEADRPRFAGESCRSSK